MAKAPTRKRLGAPPGERLAAMEQWVDSHETHCAERYGDLQNSIHAVGQDITSLGDKFAEALKEHSKAVWGRFWLATGALIAVLIATSAWLIIDKIATLGG